MKEHLARLQAAQAEVKTATDKIAELTAKADSMRGSLESLRISAAEKSAAKERVLDKFVRGEAIQADVDRAREAHDKAEGMLRDSRDLAGATDRVIKELERKIPELVSREALAERDLWRAVADRERDEAIKAAGDRVWRYFAACNAGAGGANFPNFFTDIFGPLRLDQVQELKEKLRREVFGDRKA